MPIECIQIRKKNITTPLLISYLRAKEKETGKEAWAIVYDALLNDARKWEKCKNINKTDNALIFEVRKLLDEFEKNP